MSERKQTAYVHYDSNNSGGRWRINDEQWRALEKAGWKVHWASLANAYDADGNYVREPDGTPKLIPAEESKTSPFRRISDGGRFLGALATEAYKPDCASLRDAVDEWERVTGARSTDAGCACCGKPHSFTLYVDEKYVESGPHAEYVASW